MNEWSGNFREFYQLYFSPGPSVNRGPYLRSTEGCRWPSSVTFPENIWAKSLDNFGLQGVADEQPRCSRGMPERLGHLSALKPLLGQLSDHWDTKPVYFLAFFTSQPTYLASEFPIITTIAIRPQEIQEIQPPYALHWECNFQQMKFHEWLDIDTLPHSCMFNRCF